MLAFCLAACNGKLPDESPGGKASGSVVVYSSLDEALMTPVYQAFREDSGIRVQQTTADETRLLQMIRDKGRSPPADLFIADGAVTLSRAVQEDVFRPTYAANIKLSVPEQLQHPDQLWFGFAVTSIVIALNSSVSRDDEPDSYEALAEERFQGRICLTSSSHPENVMLIASLIERHGHRGAELIVRRLIANLAMPVFSDRQSMLSALKSGQCQAAILRIDAATSVLRDAAGGSLRTALLTAAPAGTLIDVVGAGVTRHAGNPDAARKFLLWLAGEQGQRNFSEQYRTLAAVPSNGYLQQPGSTARTDSSGTVVARLGALYEEAIDLAERAHYP